MSGEVWKDGIDMLFHKLESWGETAIEMLPNVVVALVVLFLFWWLSQWVFKLFKKLFLRTEFNQNLENLLANIAQLIVIAAGFVIALSVLDLQKTVLSLLAGVGVVGIALGFAFQDLASNFISGIMLAIRAPMSIGDVIDIKGVMGKVTEINLRDTVIRNFTGQDIYMPNKEFTSNHFVNYSQSGFRRINMKVGVGYEDSIEDALDIIRAAVAGVGGVLTDPAPDVYVSLLADSAVEITIDVFFAYPGEEKLSKITNDCLVAIKRDLDTAEISIPYPVRTLTLQTEAMNSVKKWADDYRKPQQLESASAFKDSRA